MTDGLTRYEISSDGSRFDVDVIHAYLVRSYWSPGITRAIVERAVRNSLGFGAFEFASGNQVGFLRVVTDHTTFAYLCDVFVLEEHRGQGLGKAMMNAAMSHPSLAGARRMMLATRDAHGLYRGFGFTEVDRSATLMEVLRPDIYRTATR